MAIGIDCHQHIKKLSALQGRIALMEGKASGALLAWEYRFVLCFINFINNIQEALRFRALKTRSIASKMDFSNRRFVSALDNHL